MADTFAGLLEEPARDALYHLLSWIALEFEGLGAGERLGRGAGGEKDCQDEHVHKRYL
jgi:hypothetical protein